jgi:hypothetical protein
VLLYNATIDVHAVDKHHGENQQAALGDCTGTHVQCSRNLIIGELNVQLSRMVMLVGGICITLQLCYVASKHFIQSLQLQFDTGDTDSTAN